MLQSKTKMSVGAVAALLVFALTGCAEGSSAEGVNGGTDASLSAEALATAEQNLAPYLGQASAFPIDEPLAKKPAPDATLAFLQCATPICALQVTAVANATKSLFGTDLIVVKAGPSAQDAQQAMDSIIAQKPSAVILPTVDPVSIRAQMEQLAKADIPVVALGVTNTEDFPGIEASIMGKQFSELAGKLFADWAVTTNGSAPSVFYTVPELGFSPIMEAAYKAEMSELCPECEVRVVKIPITSIGSTAPTTVANDLRANPQTKTAIFSTSEAATGLPAALKVADIEVAINGFAPSPTILGYIQSGDVTAGLAVDDPIAAALLVDVAARILTGQKLSDAQVTGMPTMQMVTKADVEGQDVSKGFAAHPDSFDRFDRLWNGE